MSRSLVSPTQDRVNEATSMQDFDFLTAMYPDQVHSLGVARSKY